MPRFFILKFQPFFYLDHYPLPHLLISRPQTSFILLPFFCPTPTFQNFNPSLFFVTLFYPTPPSQNPKLLFFLPPSFVISISQNSNPSFFSPPPPICHVHLCPLQRSQKEMFTPANHLLP